jgi:hypothetical protein
LQFESVFNDFLLTRLSLNAHLEDFVNDLLEIFNEIIVSVTALIRLLVDYGHKDLTIISDRTAQGLQIAINLQK